MGGEEKRYKEKEDGEREDMWYEETQDGGEKRRNMMEKKGMRARREEIWGEGRWRREDKR